MASQNLVSGVLADETLWVLSLTEWSNLLTLGSMAY